MNIDGKVALVTGAGSGIGRATAHALARHGATDAIVDRDMPGLQDTLQWAEHPDRLHAISCDVTDTADLAAAFRTVLDRFGRLDIVTNIAGIGESGELFADESDDWRRVIDIDLTAVIDATRLAVLEMRRARTPGVIVNLASLIALEPMADAPVYSAAKAGVVGFTRALATLAEREGIRVNAVCPELVDTPMALAMGADTLNELRDAGSLLAPGQVAETIIDLITDDHRAGAIVRLTRTAGATVE
jgi:NAD(P)-dependent dehydrogenase (short-subunit alcohol dehydrogenase family)